MTRRIGLVGCVGEKMPVAAPARELYTSALFVGRRAFVERSCNEWWILSAPHGLVSPDQVVEPYDATLKRAGRAERRRWSTHVLAALDARVRPTAGEVIEIHAGAEYRDFGLTEGLHDRGCHVVIPTEGMRIGTQRQFYNQARASLE